MPAEPIRQGLNVAGVLRRQARWAEAAKALDRVAGAVDALPEGDPLRAEWMVATAEAVQILGGSDRARVLVSTALRLAEAAGLDAVHAQSLRVLGSITWRTGDLRGGRTLLERALDRARALDDADGAVRCCIELSHICLDQGRLEDAESLLDLGLEIAGDDPVLSLLPQAPRANTFQRRADREGATVRYEATLAAARKVKHRMVEGMAQHGLANLALERRDLKLALARIREAHKAYHRAGYVFGEAQCYNVLGEAHRLSGEPGPAARAYERAIRAGDAVGHPGLVPRANLAVLRMEAGRLGDARALIEQVLAVAEQRGLRPIVASMHALLLPCVVDDERQLQIHLVRATQGLAETAVYDRDLGNAARLAGETVKQPALAVRCRALALSQFEQLGDAAAARAERAALHALAEAGAPIPAGPFDLVDALGEGAMGEVWAARHRMGFEAAVKVVAAAPRRTRLLELLEGEARAVVGLDHPNIVRLIDYGTLGPDAAAMRSRLHADAPWFAMERIRGGDMEALCGNVEWDRARELILQLLSALGHAHSRGVLHLDVKPANVLLTDEPRPRAKLVDFGLAAVLSAAGGKVRIAGTPLYMAPEQFRGEPRDWGPWTDLYALGCLAVHLVCGAPPFPGDSLREVRDRHLRGEPEFTLPDDVPAGFDGWVRGLLAREASDRFRFAADAVEALRWIDIEHHTVPLPIAPEAVRPAPDRARSGLALFDLRRPPLVGRSQERRRLWTALKDVITKEEPRVVVLRGSSGVGKSALARWLAEKAHAEGRASTLRAESDADHPIGALVEDRLRVGRLSLEQAELRIAQREASLDDSSIGALAEVGTGHRSEGFRLADAVGAFVRLVETDCQDRPVVLHVEGSLVAHPELVQLAEALRASGLAILLIMELRPEELPARGRGRMGMVPGAITIDIGSLPHADVRALLDAMLPLDASLGVALTDRADGNPRLALHLLGSLIRREAVSIGPGGVTLPPGVRLDLPDDVISVWRDRLDEVLSGLGDDAWLILAIGALLGARVLMSDWRVSCEVAGVGGMSGVLRRLRVARLAVPTADRGLAFAHPVLRDVVLALARERGVLAKASLGAAAAPSLDGDPGRRGELLADAGEIAEAEPLLRQGVKRALTAGDVVGARRLCDRCADALRGLGTPPDAPVWAGLYLLQCRMAVEDANIREAEECAERALTLAKRHNLRSEHAHALRWMATTDWLSRRADLALDGFRDALVCFEALDDPIGQARCHQGIAVVLRSRARLDDALLHLDRARVLMREDGDEHLLTSVYCSVGDIHRRQGRLDEAREAFEEGLRLAENGRETGLVSTALLGLGELARKRGDLDEAERYYREALRRRSGGQRLKAAMAQLNLALVALHRGKFDQAEELLAELLDRLDVDGDSAVVVFAQLCRLPIVAVRDDGRWAPTRAVVEGLLENTHLLDPDVAWCLELAGDRASGVGFDVRAEWLWHQAASHWEALGEPEKAREASAKIAQEVTE